MINIGIGIGWAKALYSVANNIIANFKARVLSYPNSIFEAGPCLDTTLEELNAIGLLDNASIIVTPNAYNEGVLYDVVPNTPLGDMNVVRATTATRVNEQGLIEVVPRNILTYSNSFTSGNWAQARMSIASNTTISPDGTQNASSFIEDNTLNSHPLYVFNVNYIVGQTYTVTIFVKKGSRDFFLIGPFGNGTAIFNLTNGTTATSGATITPSTNGFYRCSFTYTAVSASTEIYFEPGVNGSNVYQGDGSTSLYIYGAQVENFATATEYFPTTTRLNIPRIDYTNGSCPSLLVEPQRTNVSYQSTITSFPGGTNQWTNGGNQPAQINQTIGINGTQNGTKYTKTIGALAADFLYKTAVPVTLGTVYTVSGYIKLGTATNAVVVVNDANAWDSVPNGSIVCSSANGFNTTEWKRFKLTIIGPSTYQINVHYGYHQETGVAAQADGTFFLDGLQVEAGSYATSLIPTAASSVTRNADVISKTGISSLIGQIEGTMFSSFYYSGNATGGVQLYPLYIGQGTFTDSVTIGLYDNALLCRVFTGGVAQNYFTSSALSIGNHKVAFVYANNNLKLFLDGVLIASNASASIPTCSQINIGSSGTTTLVEKIEINNNILFKTALADAECISLTTL